MKGMDGMRNTSPQGTSATTLPRRFSFYGLGIWMGGWEEGDTGSPRTFDFYFMNVYSISFEIALFVSRGGGSVWYADESSNN